jgi:hypothetical protein
MQCLSDHCYSTLCKVPWDFAKYLLDDKHELLKDEVRKLVTQINITMLGNGLSKNADLSKYGRNVTNNT